MASLFRRRYQLRAAARQSRQTRVSIQLMFIISRILFGLDARQTSTARAGGLLWLLVTLSLSLHAQTAQSGVPRPPQATSPAATAVPHPPDKQPKASSDQDAGTTIRVNVKLVNVFSTVTNPGGAPVSSLKARGLPDIRGWQAAKDRGLSARVRAAAIDRNRH